MTHQVNTIQHNLITYNSIKTLELTQDSTLSTTVRLTGSTYPRLTSYDTILMRALAIADNLDEVMMLPKNMIFPLRAPKKPLMRRKVGKAKNTDNAHLGKRQREQQEQQEELEIP